MVQPQKQTAVVQSSQRDRERQRIQSRATSRIKGMAIRERLKRLGLLSSENNEGDRIKVREVMSRTD